jgi:hypothetical protein
MNNVRQELYKELRRIEEDSLYSMKGHFNAADFWSKINIFMGVTGAIAAAIAGLTSLAEGYQWLITLSALFSAIIIGINTFLNASEKAQAHKSSGNSFYAIRSDARFLSNIESSTLNDNNFIAKANNIRERKNKINSEALGIPKYAYQKAKKGIESGEPDYEVDNEH